MFVCLFSRWFLSLKKRNNRGWPVFLVLALHQTGTDQTGPDHGNDTHRGGCWSSGWGCRAAPRFGLATSVLPSSWVVSSYPPTLPPGRMAQEQSSVHGSCRLFVRSFGRPSISDRRQQASLAPRNNHRRTMSHNTFKISNEWPAGRTKNESLARRERRRLRLSRDVSYTCVGPWVGVAYLPVERSWSFIHSTCHT